MTNLVCVKTSEKEHVNTNEIKNSRDIQCTTRENITYLSIYANVEEKPWWLWLIREAVTVYGEVYNNTK